MHDHGPVLEDCVTPAGSTCSSATDCRTTPSRELEAHLLDLPGLPRPARRSGRRGPAGGRRFGSTWAATARRNGCGPSEGCSAADWPTWTSSAALGQPGVAGPAGTPTRCSKSSAAAAWGWCSRPSTPRCTGRWRSRCWRRGLAANGTARKRFAREAQAAAAVSHDHVVPVHAVDAEATPPYLVMEYIPGQSLQERLDQGGPLELRENPAHRHADGRRAGGGPRPGLVHRDIKPANILLENGVERVRITDFGLARAVDDASLTQSGTVAGTPQYMAPEQADGGAVDQRADLFSLGSVLYAMCTGRAPFRGDGGLAVLRQVCDTEPLPIRELNPDVPAWLAAIIGKLHAKDPARRFQSAAEVADLLEHAWPTCNSQTATAYQSWRRNWGGRLRRQERHGTTCDQRWLPWVFWVF